MYIHDCANFGIVGNAVSGLNLANSVVGGSNGTNTAPQNISGFAGAIDGEASIAFVNLSGTGSITNTDVSGGVNDNISIQGYSGTLNFLTISGCTIHNTHNTSGNDGIYVHPWNTANMTVKILNNTLTANRGDHLDMQPEFGTTSQLVFTGNTMTGGHA